MSDIESLNSNNSSRDDDIARWRILKKWKRKRQLTKEEEREFTELDDDFEGVESRD